MYLLLFFFL